MSDEEEPRVRRAMELAKQIQSAIGAATIVVTVDQTGRQTFEAAFGASDCGPQEAETAIVAIGTSILQYMKGLHCDCRECTERAARIEQALGALALGEAGAAGVKH